MVYLSYRGDQSILLATREAEFENSTFLPYDFHFLLPENNYLMLEFIFKVGK